MATILVVDDDVVSRELLRLQLELGGHQLLEAADGAEALAIARAKQPDLVITDVLMPRMDGFEFVQKLRDVPGAATMPVIFLTAIYFEPEARDLASRCGVNAVLSKPTAARELLRAVDLAVGATHTSDDTSPAPDFERAHLRLVSDTLVRNAGELSLRNSQLTALVDLGLRLAAEPDPTELLQLACTTAREILGAEAARVWLFDPGVEAKQTTAMSGPTDVWEAIPLLQAAELGALATEGRVLGRTSSDNPQRTTLTTPIATRSQVYGGLSLTGGPDHGGFEPEAENLLALLVSHISLAYQNAQRTQELRVALQARDEFLMIAAHELKTPLTSLGGYAQLLKSTLVGQETVDAARLAQPLRTIERQTIRLSRLVERLLDVSRLETGNLIIRRETTDVAVLVREVIEMAQAGAAEHVLVVHAPGTAMALIDPLRLEQVLMNLLDNAQKFSPPGTQVSLEVTTPDPCAMQIVVQDQGTGVPVERRDRLFDRFYQAHGDSNQSGMGLGLHLCRRIVELHGGLIWAEFPATGGTRVVVHLPTESTAQG